MSSASASSAAGSSLAGPSGQSSSSSSRVVVQDYIARIRYSNALPPPPTPPKLLDIPVAGIAQYTDAGFAARLAREQPLTVEADAELGMPIDMVGVPGVFFDDESYITVSEPVPIAALHPTDKALLRPYSARASAASTNSSVPFLRRTEYITAGASRNDSSAFIRAKNSILLSTDKKGAAAAVGRKPLNKDDPLHIARNIVKGFDLAYPYDRYTGPESETAVRGVEPTPAEKDAWDRPRHPTNPALKPVDTYPILPDFSATPDTGSYIIMKFKANPVGASDKYDDRLDVGLFHVVDPTPEDLEKYQEQVAAREKNPGLPPVMPQYDFDLFLPSSGSVSRMKRRLSMYAPDRDSDSLYDHVRAEDSVRAFKLQRIRRYETYQQTGSGPEAPFSESVGIALHDPDHTDEAGVDPAKVGLPKAAYLYGIAQRTSVRAKRPGTVPEPGTDDSVADVMELTIRDQNRSELKRVRDALVKYDPELPGRVIAELATGDWSSDEEEEAVVPDVVQGEEQEEQDVDEEEQQLDDGDERDGGRRGRESDDEEEEEEVDDEDGDNQHHHRNHAMSSDGEADEDDHDQRSRSPSRNRTARSDDSDSEA